MPVKIPEAVIMRLARARGMDRTGFLAASWGLSRQEYLRRWVGSLPKGAPRTVTTVALDPRTQTEVSNTVYNAYAAFSPQPAFMASTERSALLPPSSGPAFWAQAGRVL